MSFVDEQKGETFIRNDFGKCLLECVAGAEVFRMIKSVSFWCVTGDCSDTQLKVLAIHKLRQIQVIQAIDRQRAQCD
jgi:hypothetical protein